MKQLQVVLVLCCIALSACGANKMSPSQLQESMNTGRIVVDAVRYYRASRGTLPLSLGDLRPDFVDREPITSVGEPFRLYPDRFEGFLLCFDHQQNMNGAVCCFSDRTGLWDCSPSAG